MKKEGINFAGKEIAKRVADETGNPFAVWLCGLWEKNPEFASKLDAFLLEEGMRIMFGDVGNNRNSGNNNS